MSADQTIPDDERMTPAEFRSVLDYLGVTAPWAADALGVTERTVRSWSSGRHAIPDGVRVELERWESEAASAVGQIVDQAMDEPEPTVRVPLTDEVCADTGWPARWWRHVTMRAAAEVPGLGIVYTEPEDS